MEKSKITYIHIYCFSLIAIPFLVGILEYILICSGQNCTIDGHRLWRWLLSIILFFIPITLCIWSEYVNWLLKNLGHFLKRKYEEQILIFGICILTLLFFVSFQAFNIYWGEFVGNRSSKEYVTALVNVAIFVATMFAPIAGLLLYNNWKVQHNKTVLTGEAKPILKKLSEEQILIKKIINQFEMETYNPLCRFTVTDEKLDLIIEKYELLRSTNIIDFNAFAGLADRHDTNIVMMNYQNLGSDFYNFHISCKQQLKKHSDVEAEYKIKHKDLTKACNNLVYNLKNYIILK